MLRKVLSIILLLITITAFIIPIGFTQTVNTYNENITVYLIGNSALSRFNFTGTEVGFNGLNNVESSFPDISYYKLFIGRFKYWPTEYIYFSNLGYDIILSDYVSSDGAFLYVKADSINSASQFASKLGNFTGLSFLPYGTSEGTFVFISPSRFDEVINNFIWAMYPQSYGGFSSLVTTSKLASEAIAQLSFTGRKSGGSFERSVIIDFINSQIVSGNKLNTGETLFLQTRVSASNKSDLSNFKLITYGQVIVSSDAGAVKRNLWTKTSELSLAVPTKGSLSFPNITLSSGTPSLITYREISQGTLNLNEELEVQMKIRNVGTSTASDISYNDDWWSKDGKFTIVTGGSSGKIDSLAPGENRTIVYRIKLTSNAIEDYYVPPSSLKYSWKVGEETTQLFSSTNDLYLSLNQNKPSIYITAQTSTALTSFGTPNQVTIRVSNKGKYTAFNLNLAGQVLSLLPAGESWQTTIQAPLDDISSPQSEKYWICSWSDGTQTRSSRSNNLTLTNAYDMMRIPLIDLIKKIDKFTAGGKMFLNFTIGAQNVGGTEASGVTIRDSLVSGLRYINGSFSEKDGILTTLINSIKNTETKTLNYLVEVADLGKNYIFPPTSAYYTVGGIQFTRTSTTDGLPLALTISLNLEDKEAFDRYNTTGYYLIRNSGDQDIFRLETDLKTDPILKITSLNYTKKFALLKTSSEEKVNFNLMFNGVGTSGGISSNVKFFFAGRRMNISSLTVLTTSYLRPQVTLNLMGEAIEGQPFEIEVTTKNMANVTLNDISFKMILPSQVKILEGTDTIQISSLEGGKQESRTLKLSSSLPRDYKIDTTQIKYNYKGETITSPSTSLLVKVTDNLMVRYLIPLAIGSVVMIVAALLLGRIRK